ncbi:bacterio-opsin activator domain-containing protein [Halomarina litorea]|uniref:bacterio-opsin activator domain-containing protein n=1 Tax=Halomarina litorea TaxID=2961595 RepID=UPI0020C467BE|nr:bacterio-opsin activator domain-containing protein [Halomarina sp. BCD28]
MTSEVDSPDETSTSENGRESIHVLLVDDDLDFVNLTATYLNQIEDEFTVVTETRTSKGFDQLDGGSIDCIVSDYEIPAQNGIEFLRKVRGIYPDLPFILFTGKGDEEVASEAISAGVTDYLQKGGNKERFELLANRIRNAVDQYRADKELEDFKRRYERAARASSDAFVDWKVTDNHFWWSEGIGQPFGYSDEEAMYEFEWWEDRVHPADRQRVFDTIENTLANQDALVEMEYRFRRADSTYAHTISRGYITYENGEPVRLTGALIDISTQKERQKSLEHLHQTSRGLIQARTIEEISEIVVESADEILGLSAIGLYLWNEDEGVLQPQASTPKTEELIGELPTFTSGRSLAWDVFLDGETGACADVHDQDNVYDEDSSIRSELIVPLGEYGVLLSGSTSRDSITQDDVRFAETLAANATAAFQRNEREQELLEKEEVLREQNKTLTRLDRINSTIRTIQRDIVNATTRDEIEQAVCDDLTKAEQYQFAWIGTIDESGQISPRTWVGSNRGFLDELFGDMNTSSELGSLPAKQALDSGKPVSVRQFRKNLNAQPWLRKALDHGLYSMISVPIVFKDSSYGVLEIYADQATSFSAEEVSILTEVCNFVANALNAIERRQALVLQSNTELEFRIGAVNDVFFRLARHTDCTLDLNSMLPQSDGGWLLYLTVSGCNAEPFQDIITHQVSVEQVTPLEDDGDLFEVAVSDFEIATVLGEQGAKLHSLQASPDGGHLVVHLPQTADVNSFVERCTSVFSDAELVRRTQVSSKNSEGVTHLTGDHLTDRQRDVLEVAYRNGFFEWPRESTGEEIANRLDVSPPTFHRHVRIGTHKLLKTIFK